MIPTSVRKLFFIIIRRFLLFLYIKWICCQFNLHFTVISHIIHSIAEKWMDSIIINLLFLENNFYCYNTTSIIKRIWQTKFRDFTGNEVTKREIPALTGPRLINPGILGLSRNFQRWRSCVKSQWKKCMLEDDFFPQLYDFIKRLFQQLFTYNEVQLQISKLLVY